MTLFSTPSLLPDRPPAIRRAARLLAAALLVGLTAAPVAPIPASAQVPIPGVRPTQEGIELNFQNVELAYVITALSQAAGINVAHSNLPSAQVTLRTAEPVPAEQVSALIRQLAIAHNVVVTEANGFLQLQGPPEEAEIQPPRQLYIQRLRHARALVLAGTLQSLFGGGPGPTASQQRAQTLSQQLREFQVITQEGGQPPQVVVRGGEQQSGELEGNVQIVPDEVTNSLLVRATEADWAVIQQAIQALDLRPLQVVIEVVIAEVRRTDDLTVGVSVSADDLEGTPEEGAGFTLTAQDVPEDFTLRFIQSGDVDISATISALSATGNVRILSRPVIQAQNNQEARILVGTERPFVQVSRTLPTDEAVRDEIIQYRDVGTSLTILPTINEDGYVNLLVTQEVSSATAELQFGAPVISTREAQTQLLARSGQTIVIGGLVDRQIDESRSGIPFLKDIPILGYLFGTTREFTTNSELFLFLTPYIVATDEDADRVRQEIENNVELLRMLIPIRSLLPPVVRPMIPIGGAAPDTGLVLPDTSGAARGRGGALGEGPTR